MRVQILLGPFKKMKKKSVLVLGILLACLILALVLAQDLPNYQDKYVNDFAGVFSQQQVLDLRATLSEVEQNTTAEVSVATSSECVITPSEYANKLFNKWGIGKKEKDNGLLILYCKKENKIWVETGYGLEGILPDSKLGRMLDDYYVPSRDSGKVQEGIVSFTNEVSKVIKDNSEEVIAGKAGAQKSLFWIFLIPIIFIILVIFLIFYLKKSTKEQSKSQTAKYTKMEEKFGGKSKYGIKSDALFNFFKITFSIIITILLVIFVGGIFGIIFFFIFTKLLSAIRGIRCEKDGLKMKHIGKIGQNKKYEGYKCPNGHIGGILIGAAAAGFFAGGFGGGGGGGGFGGGGFGGGASGGGGAGR